MKRIRRTISSFTLRAFRRNASNGEMREGWFYQKRKESTLTQSDPSPDDGFDISAFYVEGQLDFPNQVPGDVLQIYHELYDMEQKVKELENEIEVYMMSTHSRNRPPSRRGSTPSRRIPNFVPRQCCIPGLWNCGKPVPSMNQKGQRRSVSSRLAGSVANETPQRSPRPPVKNTRVRSSVDSAVQTNSTDHRGSRLSKVSWNSKVDVRYIGSGIQSDNYEKAPMQGAQPPTKGNEALTNNVVHLKIKIPKDILNLNTGEGGQPPKRLENEWNKFNSKALEKINEEKTLPTTGNSTDGAKSVPSLQGQKMKNDKCHLPNCPKNRTEFPQKDKSNHDSSLVGMSLGGMTQNEPTIVSPSIIHSEREVSGQPVVGIPVKQPGRSVCDSQGCTCKGSTRNDNNLDKVMESFDMTESELSMLEEAVHNNDPVELKIQTEFGAVNVISHDPDCRCKICETFGSRHESQRKSSGRSDCASVISKKVVRVYYNGHYRNIITHTEECGCDICSNIEEHAYKLRNGRSSIVSTHQGDIIVKNKGVCGCKNCKTVEMGSHIDVETMLSRTSSNVLDQCYYSDATIPSMQSFPREVITTTDEQGASFSSPPSINSSDLSDDLFRWIPSSLNVNTSDDVDRPSQQEDSKELKLLAEEPVKETNKRKYGNGKNSRAGGKCSQSRFYNFVRPSSAKSSPAGLDKSREDNDCGDRERKNEKKNKKKYKKKLGFSAREKPVMPIERIPMDDTGESLQTNIAKVQDNKAEKTISSYTSDIITLEDLIRDLIHGQPNMAKDKVYTVTLGEVANRAYTKIHIVDCSTKPSELKRNEAVRNDRKGPMQLPSGDGSNSNVFFIKPLPSSVAVSPTPSIAVPHFRNKQNNCDGADSQSVSSPACLQGHVTNSNQSTKIISVLDDDSRVPNKSEEIREVVRSASATCPRADDNRSPLKLTIRFGKKVASFFKPRSKKKSVSNHSVLTECEGSRVNPKCRKTFTIYEGVEKELRRMELVKINMKPRYYTVEPYGRVEETNRPMTRGPTLYLVEKNSNTHVLATVGT